MQLQTIAKVGMERSKFKKAITQFRKLKDPITYEFNSMEFIFHNVDNKLINDLEDLGYLTSRRAKIIIDNKVVELTFYGTRHI